MILFPILSFRNLGKSTLINMVTGLMAPTHGSIFVKGFDVETEFFDVQQMMGVCPQHDLLWDNLTAREHMHMFAAFKGLRWGQELATAVDAMLSKVELLARADNFAGQYSGGMKRRLSVALSTVGDVEVIILDGKCY